MISLPIIFREFRVAARKRHTFVMRCAFAVFLLAVTLVFCDEGMGNLQAGERGGELLAVLSWMLMGLVGVFAPALSSGCISDEKRQGTLGLLFLTRLNSADIVLGKFVSRGVDLLMLLLAATPVLFVPILLGGVGWQQALNVLVCVLALAALGLSMGVSCSAFCRTTGAAVIASYLMVGGYNWLAIALPQVNPRYAVAYMIRDWIALASPLAALEKGDLYSSLLTLAGCLGVGALLVAASIWRLPSAMQAEMFSLPWWQAWRRRFDNSRRRPNPELLARNPIVWLHSARNRNRWLLQLIVVVALLVGTSIALAIAGPSDIDDGWDFVFIGGLGALCALKMLIVLHLALTLATEKEDGALELLLVTPLWDKGIVAGKLSAIVGRYAIVYVLVFGLSLFGGLICLIGSVEPEMVLLGVYLYASTLSSLAWAVCFAAWISLRSKSVREALLWTLLGTVLLIWGINFAVIAIAGGLITARAMTRDIGSIFLVLTVLRVAAELIFASFCYRSLTKNLRAYAART